MDPLVLVATSYYHKHVFQFLSYLIHAFPMRKEINTPHTVVRLSSICENVFYVSSVIISPVINFRFCIISYISSILNGVKIAVFPFFRPSLFQTPDSAISISKMQNKKAKHRPSTKYLYFHKITGPTLFFSGEKIEK